MQIGGWRQGGRSTAHWAKETAQLAIIIKVKNVKLAIIIKVKRIKFAESLTKNKLVQPTESSILWMYLNSFH